MKLSNNDLQQALASAQAILAKGGYNDKITPHLLLLKRRLLPLVQAIDEERLEIIKAFASKSDAGHLLTGEDGGAVFETDEARGDNQAALRALGLRSAEIPGRPIAKIKYADLPRDKDGNLKIEGLHLSHLEFMIDGIPEPMEAEDAG